MITVPSVPVTVMTASITRSGSPAIRVSQDPSGNTASTGGRRVDLARTRNCAFAPATACRNALLSNPRSASTSIPSSSRPINCWAYVVSPMAVGPNTAPSRPRVPVSTRPISITIGYPAHPIRCLIFPSQVRLRSGAFSELQPLSLSLSNGPTRTA